ncbi:MAG: hypothetical protein ABR936_10245 [Bacteroidota bacterium]|jgi:hypothetical protein
MDEKKALEEIQFIRNVIEEGKKSVVYNGKDYIFWGVIVIVGMMSTYIFQMSHVYFNYFWIWVVLIPIGWIYSLYNRRVHKIKFPSTYAGRLMASIWGAAGIGMTIIGFLGTFSGTIKPMAISPILSIIMGSAYFISGKVVGVKWISYLSFGWWIGGLILFYVTSVYSFLIMALLMLFFQTIPGILIYRKYKKEVELRP